MKKAKAKKIKGQAKSRKQISKLRHDLDHAKALKRLSDEDRAISLKLIKKIDAAVDEVNEYEQAGKTTPAYRAELKVDDLIKRHNAFLDRAFKRADAPKKAVKSPKKAVKASKKPKAVKPKARLKKAKAKKTVKKIDGKKKKAA